MNIPADLISSHAMSAKQCNVVDEVVCRYLDRSLKLKQNWLGDEDFPGLCAEVADLGFEQLNLLPRPAAPHFEQSVNDRIKINLVLIRHLVGPCWENLVSLTSTESSSGKPTCLMSRLVCTLLAWMGRCLPGISSGQDE